MEDFRKQELGELVATGDIEAILVKLRESHISPNIIVEEKGQTLLQFAVSSCQSEMIQSFLEFGCDLNKQNDNKETALHIAVSRGNMKILELLLEKGAKIDVLDENQLSAFHRAVLSGNVGIVKMFLNHGFSRESFFNGNTIASTIDLIRSGISTSNLWTPARTSHAEKSQPLLPKRESIGVKNNTQRSFLGMTSINPQIDLVGGRYNRTALQMAVRSGHAEISNLIIKKGANTKIKDDQGNALTHLSVWSGNADTVRMILGNGADFNAVNHRGYTALDSAIIAGNIRMMELLVNEAGISMDCTKSNGDTLLHRAAIEKQAEVVEFLLEKHNADPMATNKFGSTPLHFAVFSPRNVTTMKMFVKHRKDGFEINVKDAEGRSPLHIAAGISNNAEMVEYLLDNGAHIEAENHEGMTAFAIATKEKNYATMEVLLKKGAKSDSLDSKRLSPLDYAIANRDNFASRVICSRGISSSTKQHGDANSKEMEGEEFDISHRMQAALATPSNLDLMKSGNNAGLLPQRKKGTKAQSSIKP